VHGQFSTGNPGVDKVLGVLEGVREDSKDHWMALCPAHNDHDPSLRVTLKPDDGRILLKCFAGCSQEQILRALEARGISRSDLSPPSKPQPRRDSSTILKTYDYFSKDGRLLFQVVRMNPKTFRQRRPCPNNGKCGHPKCSREMYGGWWHWDLDGVERVLYHLPEVMAASARGGRVYVVEGEKDADALAHRGLVATTNPQGAGKWRAEYSEALRGACVVILPDNDEPGRRHAEQVAQSLHGIAASVRVLHLPGLPPKGDVSDWLAAGGTTEELEWLADKAPEWTPPEDSVFVRVAGEEPADAKPRSVLKLPVYAAWLDALSKTRYKADRHGNLCYVKYHQDGGEEEILIANFLARPVREVTRDNGADSQKEFEVSGILAGGRELPVARVGSKDFGSLSWVPAAWGLEANVEPGQGSKDRVRHAIQCLAQDMARETIYEHIGWRKISGEWLYLHGGGAIGAGGPVVGVTVDPGEGLRHYLLPDPPQGEALRQAVCTSLTLLHVARTEITYPLLAAVYRAPLAEALPVDLSLFYAGQTGVKKSELTALAQAHWGATFHGKNLPGNWDSTANALEKLAFLAKDAVFTVDDFAPRGAAADVQRLHREADRLLRAQGNQSGRGRMRADGSLRPEYRPRGLIMSSGEDIPCGQSLRARMLILDVGPQDVGLEQLTEAQRAARDGLLVAAMAGYVQWLAARMDELKVTMRERHEALRAKAWETRFSHDRTPDIVANLALGWQMFLSFATEAGAVGQEEAAELWRNGWAAFLAAGEAQEGHLASEEPTGRFLALLGAAITSGHAHVVDVQTEREPRNPAAWGWREQTRGRGPDAQTQYLPLGDRVGWLDGDDLLLDPEAAYAAVQKLARDQNASLSITQRVLWKRLAERGLILTEEGKERTYYTVKRTVGEQRRRVLILSQGSMSLISHNVGNVGNVGNPLWDKGFKARSAPTSLKNPQKCGQEMWAVNGDGDNSPDECPQNAPTLFEQNEKCGQKNDPETLAVQGPAHIAHKAHEIADETLKTFNGEVAATDDNREVFEV